MSYCLYEVDKAKKIATVTFNHPEKLNAGDDHDFEEFRDILANAEEDEDVKVVVLKGAGKAFGSGYDAKTLGPHLGLGGPNDPRPPQRKRLSVMRRNEGRRGPFQLLTFFNKASIAQVHGYCYGGHLEFALAADIVVASEDAQFTHPGFKYIGAIADWMLPLIFTVGLKKTKEMMLTGRPIFAAEALECGFVNKVVPREKLEEETRKMAEAVARMPFDAIVMGKANFQAVLDLAGVGAGYSVGVMTHAWQTNIHYDPGEYNFFRERAKKGMTAAFAERAGLFSEPRMKK